MLKSFASELREEYSEHVDVRLAPIATRGNQRHLSDTALLLPIGIPEPWRLRSSRLLVDQGINRDPIFSSHTAREW